MRSKNVLTFPLKKERRKTIFTKIVEFFPTPIGRAVSLFTIGSMACGSIIVNYLPQTIFFETYREYVLDPSMNDITPKEVTDDLKDLIKTAVRDIKPRPVQAKLIKTFTVSGFDIREFGSMYSKYGAWIGIPANYFYTTVDDIDKNQMLVNSQPIAWDQDSGKLLQDSLVLTDSEKTFAFCRALLELKTYRFLMNTMLASLGMIGTYTLGSFVNIKFRMFRRPFYVRYATYPLVGLIGYGLYGIIADLYVFQRERSIDEKLANLGPDMVEAGVNFYTKLLNKNKAFAEISGKDENALRNFEYRWLVFRTTPIIKRKEFFQSKLNDSRQQQKEAATAGAGDAA